ncbi:hypothetical protein ACMBCN_03575 [Candidatus Liberibacter asiaticus]
MSFSSSIKKEEEEEEKILYLTQFEGHPRVSLASSLARLFCLFV